MKTVSPDDVCAWIMEANKLKAELKDVRRAYAKKIRDLQTKVEYYSDPDNRRQGELALED